MEKIIKRIESIDWIGVITVIGWIGMGVYLWLKFWRFI